MEEAVVNAVYHRSYEDAYEPIKIYLFPNRMEITSYPGPVAGLERHHFQAGVSLPAVPNRNRRIGEFLKELKLAEGRGTGVPKILRKMEENGSPQPIFEFDETRTYFRVILPTHPQYVVIHALRESAHLWATGERERAIQNLEAAVRRVPHAGALIAQLIEYKVSLGDFADAEKLFKDSQKNSTLMDRHLPFIAMAKAFLDHQDIGRASAILAKAPSPPRIDELIELAILHKRAERLNEAHKIFSDNYDLIKNDPKALHEYAQTKMKLAASPQTRRNDVRKRLNREAVELLRRAIQLTDDHVRKAWCWFDLARNLAWLRVPETEILQAYSKATELLPDEPRFQDWYQGWKNRKNLDKK
jgi:ATP-dependent DNA helicase RecG